MEEHNLLILSDTHLGAGLDPITGRFSRLEDFLSDGAFARFLHYHEGIKEQPRFGGRPWWLVLNGDLFDFLQVVSLPEEGRTLRAVKGKECHTELSADEREYGLGTTAAESAWKMARIARGHARFFAALGWFAACGNRIVVTKGNHDIELQWPCVWRRFVTEVWRAYTRERLEIGGGRSISRQDLAERLVYCPWFYCEPGRVYVEHGGQYEAANYYPDYLVPVMPQDHSRIRLPWGSLFGRYVFNKLEDVHPFADNVRPASIYLGWAFRRAPLETLGLVRRGWTLLRAARSLLREQARGVLAGARERGESGDADDSPFPPEVTERIAALARGRVRASYREWAGQSARSLLAFVLAAAAALAGWNAYGRRWAGAAAWLGVGALVLVLRRVLNRRFRHSFADYLRRVARELEGILAPAHAVRYIVLGHDHCVAIERLGRAWYVNPGTWVRVFHHEGPIEGREEPTFFRLAHGYEGAPEVLRWDDAAGEPERVAFGLDA